MIRHHSSRRIISLGDREIGIAEGVCTGGSRTTSRHLLDSADSARQQWDKSRILLGQQDVHMLLTSYSGTLWWYSKKTRNDGIHVFRTTGRSTSFTGEEKRMTELDKQSSSHFWIHSDYRTCWKHNQDAVRIKDCNSGKQNHLQSSPTPHSARRLRWSCDFSERRSSNIREARNTMASTQGYVEEQLAYTAATATASAYSQSELHLERWESQELREELLTRTLDFYGSAVGKEMVWRFSRWTVGPHSPQKWYSNSKKLVILFSQVPVLWVVGSWSRKEAEVPFIHFNGDSVNTELLFQIVVLSSRFDKWWKKNKSLFLWTMEFWPCWCLLRTWHLETRCKEARASEYWKREYRWHTYVKKRHSSILWQQEIATNFDQMTTMDGGN